MATNTAEEAKHDSEAVGAVPDEVFLKKGPWTAAEDAVLKEYVTKHGEGNWNAVQKNTGLARCGKSCRLRWANHLRPNLKKGAFSPDEEKLIIQLHAQFGNKWARMAALLPGRTDNEIKNYWNTRLKRRRRQGLPLYSDEPDRSTTSPKPMAAASPAPPPNATRLNFLHRHRYHPLSSPTLPPHSPLLSPLEPKPAISDPMIPLCSPSSSSTSSPHSFIFSRPAPLLCNPLGFKRFRTSSGHPLRVAANTFVTSTMPQSVGYSGIGFTGQAPLFEYDRVAVLNQFANSPAKLELPSNQFSTPNILLPAESKFYLQMNNVNNGFLGHPLFEAQTALKKPSYLYPDEGNDLDGHRGFHDLLLNSSIWSSNAELKQKEETRDLSKSMTNDLSSMLAVMPSTPSVSDWTTGNAAEVSNNNVQSSGVVIPYNNFELDNKPIASLFPKTTTTNHNDNSGCFSWDDLTGLGFH